uniref:Ubiquitin carboxyl-terminal hydrolase 14 n=1 Tax=Alona affinis TaxID=381656 RepID=A0A9N6ZEC1_9CRUS|nr:EOG090X0181 [Alona affinis]
MPRSSSKWPNFVLVMFERDLSAEAASQLMRNQTTWESLVVLDGSPLVQSNHHQSRKSCEKKASELAMARLKTTNFQLVITDPSVTSIRDFLINEDDLALAGEKNQPIDTITKEAVSDPNVARPQSTIESTPSESFALKMMKKMGWAGAGLGVQEQGIVEPIQADVIVGRSGLGFEGNSKVGFEKWIRGYLQKFRASQSESKLIFSNEFTTDERKFIHGFARSLGLFTKSAGKNENRQLSVRRAAAQCRPLIDWESETGLYVCLNTFLGFGQEHVERHTTKTGNKVYLHLRKIKHLIPEEKSSELEPEKKITRLAIGVDGGFQLDSQPKYEFEEKHSVAIFPGPVMIPLPNANLPMQVENSIQGILAAQSAGRMEELSALESTWDGEARRTSKFAESLEQLNNGVRVPPQGWQCSKCDKTDNLWMNLSDGTVLCGRKFFDGTGGNNHALEHFQATGYPLAVKLGTISGDGKADVYSYAEDDMVEDPLLKMHLAHFGINMEGMQKTDKSMAELEIDLNQRVGEWASIQETGKSLVPLFGPGLTGLANLGNSCYLNSVIQVLFTVPQFQQRAKMAVGILSGRYSKAVEGQEDQYQQGIRLTMFKALIGKGHPEFSTKRQQDAVEFLLHLINTTEASLALHWTCGISRDLSINCLFSVTFGVIRALRPARRKVSNSASKSACSVSLPAKFAILTGRNITSRSQCLSKRPRTWKRSTSTMNGRKQLKLPGSPCTFLNSACVMKSEGVVRPKVTLQACLEALVRPEEIQNFFSSAINSKTTALKATRLATFPDYLWIQLRKFTLAEDWTPVKLDVAVEIPQTLDLSWMKGNGPQSGEVIMTDQACSSAPPAEAPMDMEIVAALTEMGFPAPACKRAASLTHGRGLEAATQWIMEHMDDPDFLAPLTPVAPGSFKPDEDGISMLESMGFTRSQCIKALQNTDNNVERAADWIFSHPDEINNVDDSPSAATGAAGAPPTAAAEPAFSDGPAGLRTTDGSDLKGNRMRVQVAKESFLSRLKAERESAVLGKPSQSFSSHSSTGRDPSKEVQTQKKPFQREPLQQQQQQEYNPMQMFKSRQSAEVAPPAAPPVKGHISPSSPGPKTGLKKFGGTKSFTVNNQEEQKEEEGNLMTKLEKFSGMWNDLDEAPVLIETQRKTMLPSRASDPQPAAPIPQPKEEDPEVVKKREMDNQKRIQSLEQRNQALKAQHSLIKSALSFNNNDVNKKIIRFEDPPEQSNAFSNKQGKKKRQQLFDENDEVDDGVQDFKLRPHLDGHTGHELLELQSGYGNDSRFKLDHRFAEKVPEQDEEELDEEKQRQMSILGSLIPFATGSGPPGVLADGKNRIKSKTFVRFDPKVKDHVKFERDAAGEDVTSSAIGKFRSLDQQQSLPEVSSERYYTTTGSLDIGGSSGTGFSLRTLFQQQRQPEEEEAMEENDMPGDPDLLPSKQPPRVLVQQQTGDWMKSTGMWHEPLFLQPGDVRFKEAMDFLLRAPYEEAYTVREKWADHRERLKHFYRNKMRRQGHWSSSSSAAGTWQSGAIGVGKKRMSNNLFSAEDGDAMQLDGDEPSYHRHSYGSQHAGSAALKLNNQRALRK